MEVWVFSKVELELEGETSKPLDALFLSLLFLLGCRWFIIICVGSIMVLVGRRCQKLGQLVSSNAMNIKILAKIFHNGCFDVEISGYWRGWGPNCHALQWREWVWLLASPRLCC